VASDAERKLRDTIGPDLRAEILRPSLRRTHQDHRTKGIIFALEK